MFVKIVKLEDKEETLTTFSSGIHIIGRGTALQCNDKRVSRNHATLEISGDTVTLTSVHSFYLLYRWCRGKTSYVKKFSVLELLFNPPHWEHSLSAANSKTITILANHNSCQLNDGDAFAFLPDEFWFIVKICEGDLTSPVIVKEEETIKGELKRYLSDPEQGTSEKKIKVENSDSLKTPVKEEEIYNLKKNDEYNAELNHESNTINIKTEEPTIKQEENCTINLTNNNMDHVVNNEQSVQMIVGEEDKKQVAGKNTCRESIDATENKPSIDDQSTISNGDKKQEKMTSDQTAAGTSKVKSRRERCWYGAQCYRKNPQHRDDFSHPGDSDFESDPEDDRPACSFGATCYRKNKEHRRSYKHPPGKPPIQKTKRSRKKVDRLNVADYDDSDLSDLSDDPYATDCDSDEYVEDTDVDSDDTDWEDSQNVDEDSENVRRMVKEAKRFMKN